MILVMKIEKKKKNLKIVIGKEIERIINIKMMKSDVNFRIIY